MYKIVKDFEKAIAKYAGAKYGVAVSSCTNAIFLCLKYMPFPETVKLPKRTYPGVACSILNAGHKIKFIDKKWKGVYQLKPFLIYDSALRFRKDMYREGYYCLSFHYKKHIPIGRGGMILTDNKEAIKWFNQMKFDGRHEGVPLHKDRGKLCGYNLYMTPEQALRGLMLFDRIKDESLPDLNDKYPDLSKWEGLC